MASWTSYSVSDLPERERAAVWKSFIARVLDGDFEKLGNAPFDPGYSTRAIGPLTASQSHGNPVLFRHRREHAGPRQKHLVGVQVVLEGEYAYFSDAEGPMPVKSGDVFLFSSGKPFSFVTERPRRVASLEIPRALMMPRYVAAEGVAKAFRRDDPKSGFAAGLLFDFVSNLAQGRLGHARSRTVLEAAGSLMALALDGANDGGLGEDAVLEAKLAAIRDHLRAHYADPALSPATVAERFAISVRHLHRLMAGTGRSFREELLEIRLSAAFCALFDRRNRARTIADIAFASGFADLSQFNRNFRTRFDMTPRQARAGANCARVAPVRVSTAAHK